MNQLNLNFNYCNANQIWAGQNNIALDPFFIDILISNYTLSPNSPCIDSGTTDTNFDGIDDIENYYGTNPDIGYYEYYINECGEIGDINNDYDINILDIIYIANCILIDCSNNCSDINSDNYINILDIINLINIILSF